MRHHTMLLALAATLSLGLSALAADAGKPACSGHDCATDKACDTAGKCGPNHEKCGPSCPKASKKDADACDPKAGGKPAAKGALDDCCKPDAKPGAKPAAKPDCCEAKGKDDCDDKDCKEHHGKPSDKDCCEHASKADCKDKDCKEHAKGKEACEEDCEDSCEHHQGGHREVFEYRYRSDGPMGGMHGMMAHGGKGYMLGYQANTPNGRGYTMVGMDRLFGAPSHNTWWNPAMGPSCRYGMDLGDQTNTRHLGYAGWLSQNTFHFGPVAVTAGVMLGGGLNVDVTPTISFQNYNGFFVADPRLSLGWQVTPRMAVSLTGNYLLTTRPAAIGGPGAGLQFSYGF
jgi:hypothetical protein